MSVKDKVASALQEFGFCGGETIVVGFSGGADSVTLLHTLRSLREQFNLDEVVAVHIDHRLRGEEADRDRRFAENFCKERDIPFYVYTYNVQEIAQKSGKGLEETGRQVRYQAFSDVASRFDRAYIATAHTMDDNAETLLLHLCRGCGVKGLGGIAPMRETVIRPLLLCSREEIETYCSENKLPYVLDSSNSDVTYSRNRIRHRVLPELRKINPAVNQAFSRLMSHMRDVDDFLDQEAMAHWESLFTENEDIYSKTALLKLPSLLQTVLLEKLLKNHGISSDEQHLSQMRQSLVTGSAVSLPGGYLFLVSGDSFYFHVENESNCQPMTPPLGKTVQFYENTYRLTSISKKEYEQKLNISKFLFKNACDYDMISGVVMLRSRQDGDAYRPTGRGCTKTLKKLFNEAAILPIKRKQVPVLCDENGILLVEGFGCDERVRITEATQQVLLLEKIGE